MAKEFPREIVQAVTAELVPSDQRNHMQMVRVRGALNELKLGRPKKAIAMLDALGRELGQHRALVDELLVALHR
jgi:hypothetical protein